MDVVGVVKIVGLGPLEVLVSILYSVIVDSIGFNVDKVVDGIIAFISVEIEGINSVAVVMDLVIDEEIVGIMDSVVVDAIGVVVIVLSSSRY
jgi:hypothetical protein